MIDKEEFQKEVTTFEKLYGKLETLIKLECEKYNIKMSPKPRLYQLIEDLIKEKHMIRYFKKDLNLILDIRHICTHQKDSNFDYPACPSPKITERLQEIVNLIEKPPLISESKIMLKWNNIYKREITDNVLETIKTMSENIYTFVPIFENKKLIGVFSENTLLDIIKEKGGIILDEKTDFSDSEFEKVLKIENHSMEEFKFIPRDTNIFDAKELFNNYFSNDKVLGCVFVTEHGKKEENILGMFTAWDVLGK